MNHDLHNQKKYFNDQLICKTHRINYTNMSLDFSLLIFKFLRVSKEKYGYPFALCTCLEIGNEKISIFMVTRKVHSVTKIRSVNFRQMYSVQKIR